MVMTAPGQNWSMTAALGVLLALPSAQAEPTPEELAQWVRHLSHEEYARREAAVKNLGHAGMAAFPLVLEAAMGGDPEGEMRAGRVLVILADAFEPGVDEAMLRELEARRESSDPRIAKRAEVLIEMMTGAARNCSAAHLSELGLEIGPNAEKVTSLRLGEDWEGKDDDLRHLIRFPEIATLNLSKTDRITDEALKILPRLPNLEKLYLGGTSIEGPGLIHLKDVPTLKYISFQHLGIGNAEAVHVAPLVGLEHLGFDYTKVQDEALVHVTNLKALQTLWLNGAEIDGPGLLHLKELPNLNKLVLAKAEFDDVGMASLAQLTQIKHLGLDDTKITDEGAKHLASLVNLEKLWLNRTALSDASIPVLAKLTKLEKLYVPGCKITPEGIAKLQELLPTCEITSE